MESIHKNIITSDTNCKFRSFSTLTSRLIICYSLTELSESYCTHRYGLLKERPHIRMSQRKRCLWWSLGRPHMWRFHCFQDALPSCHWCLAICTIVGNMPILLAICQSWKLIWAWVFRVFTGVPLSRHDWLIDIWCGPRRSYMSYLLSINFRFGPRTPMWMKMTFLLLEKFQRLRGYLQEAKDKGQTSPWARSSSLLDTDYIHLMH